jgi:hypothetical protein
MLNDQTNGRKKNMELPADGTCLAALAKKPSFHAELLHNVRDTPTTRSHTDIPHRKHGHWELDE